MVKVYIPVLPQSHLKYLQISHLCVAYTIIAPFSGKSLLFKVKKEGKHSKVANFAVKKIRVDGLHFHLFMQCKLAM